MQWEVLVISIHICCISVRQSLVQSNWALDSFIFRIKDFGDIALQLVSLRLNIFYGEAYDCATNLNCHSMLGFESKLVLEQNNGSKFGGVIFNIEAILLALYNCMTSTHTDIIDSHLAFMASSKLEFRLFRCHSQ